MTAYMQALATSFQHSLLARLKAHRLALQHPVAKGQASENEWIEVLENHLPKRYRVGSAFIVDSKGALSDQIDLVIYDRQYTPLLYNDKGQRILPAESVYAVFEVKQSLSKARVEYAGKKVASVRRLKRTSFHAEGQPKRQRLFPILGGVLTYQSSWKPPLGEPFHTSLSGLSKEQRLDLGCVAIGGAFEAQYGAKGPKQVHVSLAEEALVSFLIRLLHRLQALGTAPAIDYAAYSTAFDLGP